MKKKRPDANTPDNIPSYDALELQGPAYRGFQTKKKKCEECGKSFIGKTIASRFCSLKCTHRNYYQQNKQKIALQRLKKNKRKLSNSAKPKLARAIPPKDKDFLSVKDFAARLGVCKQTIYNMQLHGQVRIHNFTKRLSYICWSEFESMTLQRTSRQSTPVPTNEHCDTDAPKARKSTTPKLTTIIPTQTNPISDDPQEWVTLDQACERYSMPKKASLYAYINKRSIPRKREYGVFLYSVTVLDKFRSFNVHIPSGFISSVETQKKYQVTEQALFACLKKNNIMKIKKGREIYIPEAEIAMKYRLRKTA